ncbi:heat shock factor protein-like isoform X2 [Acanthaster planci]|uniref:Heat shock factor protein-like isoform X2 n=1 Tax=Acanthaster planci TaxID=133434 RepID=A0A8B7XW98_ACAPL|nr:heat shock factor protein-like isoform X2 [Acanthaster planci]
MEKKEVNGPSSSVPGFLAKLWLLVEDAETNELIGWGTFGNSFVVQNQTRFAKEILPKFFKHSNMASFIRQLNMYGFRKKANLEQGSLKMESDEIEFQHPNFVKGRPELLDNIKRKVSTREESKLKLDDVHQILTDVQDMKGKQDNISGALDAIQRENQILWREVVYLRQRHEKQQKIVSRLLQFLLTMVKPVGLKRKQQLMIEPAQDPSKPKYSRLASPRDNIQVIESVPFDSGLVSLSTDNVLSSGAVLSDITDAPAATGQPLSSPGIEPGTAAVSDLTPATLDPSLFELEIAPASADTAAEGTAASPIVTSPASLEPGSANLSPPSGGGDGGMYASTDWPLSEGDSQVDSGMTAWFNGEDDDSQVPDVTGNSPGSSLGQTTDYSLGTTASSGSKAIMKRMLSHEEQRGEIGEHVNTVQENLDLIQNMLTSMGSTGAYNFDMDSLMQDLFPNLTSSIPQSSGSQDNQEDVRGNEVVQYVSLSSPSFTAEDEDSLLRSLDDDAAALAKPYSKLKN